MVQFERSKGKVEKFRFAFLCLYFGLDCVLVFLFCHRVKLILIVPSNPAHTKIHLIIRQK